MRNLKKILALVLALMMVVSVMATASALDFADKSEIEKTEAVSVMTGLEVLAGKPTADGEFNFDPKGSLKRQEAAKMLAYVMTGDYGHIDAAASLGHPFTDVAAGDWAEGFIAYCYNAGLMNGNGKGTFGYNKTLTGYALGKMLLCAVGIGTAADYEGLGWELAVYKALKANNLLTDVAVSGKDITREDAAQLIWNVMNWTAEEETVGYVVWNDTDNDGLVGKNEKVLYSGDNETYAVIYAVQKDASFKQVTIHTGSLADKVFGLTSEEKVDDLGRVTYVYESELIKDMEVVVVKDIDPVVLAAKVKGTDALTVINKSLGLKENDYLKATKDAEKPMTVWVNGIKDGTYTINAGDTIEVYLDDEGDVAKVIVISETFVQAICDNGSEIEGGENDGKYVWYFTYKSGKDTVKVEKIAEADAYVDTGYYLAVIKPAEGEKKAEVLVVSSIGDANLKKGVATKQGENHEAKATEYIVIDGVKYPLATGFVDYSKKGVYAYTVKFDMIMNSNGYVVAATDPEVVAPTEAEWGYAYLLDAELMVTINDDKGDIFNKEGDEDYTYAAAALLALPNAEEYVEVPLYYTVKNNEITVDGVKLAGIEANVKPYNLIKGDKNLAGAGVYASEGWVKYTIKENGSYSLTFVNTLGKDLVLKQNDANIGGLADDVYATSETVWCHYVFDEVTQLATMEEKIGYTKFPGANSKVDPDTSIAAINKLNAHLVDSVDSFEYKEKPAAQTTTTTPYAFYLGQGDWFAETATTGAYANSFAVNGGLGNAFLKGVEFPAYEEMTWQSKIYKLTLDAKGTITAADAVASAQLTTGTVKFVDPGMTYIILDEFGNDVELFLDKNVQIINVAGEEPTGEFDTVTGALNDAKLTSHGDKVYVVRGSADKANAAYRTIVTIFIYENAQ